MNLVVMQGNITRDIELIFAQGSGLGIAKFGIAVSRMKKGETDFFNCVSFGKTAETISECLHKGSPILITGHLQSGNYENKKGDKVYTTDVIVDRFDFIGKKEDTDEQKARGSEYTSNPDLDPINDQDIPFN